MQRKGMVDALREARRVLRLGAILVDARPDSRVVAKVLHGGRVVGTVATRPGELRDDRAADRAVALSRSAGLFRRERGGRFWHRLPFEDLAALEGYLSDHLRFAHRITWRPSVARARRAGWRRDPFVLERAVRFDVLRAAPFPATRT